MYMIYCGENLIYSPNLISEGYGVILPKIEKEVNRAGALTFTITPNHPHYGDVRKLQDEIVVKDDNKTIFKARVLEDEKDFYNKKRIYCEGKLAVLNDSVYPPYTHQDSPELLFENFIRNHNSLVNNSQRLTMGSCTVTDANEYIYRENGSYSKTLDELQEKLVKSCGGYLDLKYGAVDTLNYLEEYPRPEAGQEIQIEFGKNLLDITEYMTAEEIRTCIIPLGAKTQGDERVTIKSVHPSGYNFLEDKTLSAQVGRIWETVCWDDVTIPQNLMTKAQKWLDDNKKASISITVSAVDLAYIGESAEKIDIGSYARVKSIPHNIDEIFMCSKVSLDLANPGNNSYTFGISKKTMVDRIAGKGR